MINFDSNIKLLNKFEANNDNIKNEPMFFNSSIEYAYVNGSDITKNFIDNLPSEFKNSKCVFDSRVHMLMPGWYPAIPAYHHDDVPRQNNIATGKHFITAGQPNYENPSYKSEHILGLVNAEICPTEFIIGNIDLPIPDKDELVYRKWHFILEEMIKENKVSTISTPDRQLVYFNCDTFILA
jgi:hypothetical protein